MKTTYQVELKYESYALYEIEATSKEEAEALAWQYLQRDDTRAYGEWSLDSIAEVINQGESK